MMRVRSHRGPSGPAPKAPRAGKWRVAGIALAIVLAPSVAGASNSDARRACTALGTKAATRRVLTAAANNLEHVKTSGAHG